MNTQRGSFRNLTEASLQAEIATKQQGNHDVEMRDNDQDGDEGTTEDRNQKAQQAREEMLKLSKTEAFHALEFISFLLSKYRPAQAKASVSDASIQRGTLEAKSINRKEALAESRRTVEDVSRGYKMEAFRSCSEHLLNASSRICNDASSETRYWEVLMSLKAQGWAVSRIPRTKDVWAVHFGSSESRPMFRDRGRAKIKWTIDGAVQLDFGELPLSSKSLKVEVLDTSGRSLSTSQLRKVPVPDTPNEIQLRVLQARNALFEEELFLEMAREATILASYSVVARPGTIVYPLGPKHKARISLVNLDDLEVVGNDTSTPELEEDLNADRIALVLRLLLSHAHRQNLKRRSQPPPPMTTKPRSTPEYYLIRPLLAYSELKHVLRQVQNLLSNLASPCKIAGIPFSSNSSILDQIASTSQSPSTLAANNWFVGLVTEPLMTTITIRLPTSQKIDLRIRAQAASPVFGVEYSVTSSLPQYAFLPNNRSLPRLSSFRDLETFVIQSLNHDILAWMESRSHPRPFIGQRFISPASDHTTEESAMNLDESNSSAQRINTNSIRWEIFDAVEMVLASAPPGYSLGLQIQSKYLKCQLYSVSRDSSEPVSKVGQGYFWSSTTAKDGSSVNMLESVGKGGRRRVQMRTLIDVVGELIEGEH
ncbi:MAG: hypothetical protein Q9160_000036 [Pyrenula sp. 1 TL-2023]